MKNIFFLIIALFITSCGSSNYVCGGKGGKRCVEITPKINRGNFS